MSFYIVKGNIFKQKTDAIVITTSPGLKLEGQLGGMAYKICGDKLEYELSQMKKPPLSQCVITNAYNLDCKRIIHVVTPKWNGGDNDEEEYLRQAYLSCLYKMEDFELSSIAFPLLSAGNYKFPKNKAIDIAIEVLSDYASKNEEVEIALVIYENSTWNSYYSKMKRYIISSDGFSEDLEEEIRVLNLNDRGISRWYTKGSEKILEGGVETQEIGQRLQFYIKSKGLSAFDCYNGVISKTGYDKIIKKESIPKKYTLVALGLNIGLDEGEINDLLEPLGEF